MKELGYCHRNGDIWVNLTYLKDDPFKESTLIDVIQHEHIHRIFDKIEIKEKAHHKITLIVRRFLDNWI